MVKVTLNKKVKSVAKVHHKFDIDCSLPMEDNIIVPKDFAKYLTERIKVEGKTGNLGEAVTVSYEDTKVVVNAHTNFSKRYLKYLSKRYLKKIEVREYLRVVATGKNSYQLRYFKVPNEDDEE